MLPLRQTPNLPLQTLLLYACLALHLASLSSANCCSSSTTAINLCDPSPSGAPPAPTGPSAPCTLCAPAGPALPSEIPPPCTSAKSSSKHTHSSTNTIEFMTQDEAITEVIDTTSSPTPYASTTTKSRTQSLSTVVASTEAQTSTTAKESTSATKSSTGSSTASSTASIASASSMAGDRVVADTFEILRNIIVGIFIAATGVYQR